MREITLVEAMKETLFEEMKRDEKVFMLGETVEGGGILAYQET